MKAFKLACGKTIKTLNENLTAKIGTKYCLTRDVNITITDSIRQGGVILVIQYALLMDEISKENSKKNLGTPILGSQTNRMHEMHPPL